MAKSTSDTLGILGNGQLGRMFCQAAHKRGYRTICLGTSAAGPCTEITEEVIARHWEEEAALMRFCQSCSVASVEMEHIPSTTLRYVEAHIPLYPSAQVVEICQDRIREKQWLCAHDFPVVPFAVITNEEQLTTAASQVGFPAVLKTATGGYDGYGQAKISSAEELSQKWASFQKRPCTLEAWLEDFFEISVITARNQEGKSRCFPVCENVHKNHVLALTRLPADISKDLAQQAQQCALEISRCLEVVGLLTVEFFVTRQGTLYVNELAPRPHNSGHATIEACNVSQFDLQVFIMKNDPLPEIQLIVPAMMINLLGQLWSQGTPDFSSLRSHNNIHVHLYGKKSPKAGRKMGHITALYPLDSELQQFLENLAFRQDASLLSIPPTAHSGNFSRT